MARKRKHGRPSKLDSILFKIETAKDSIAQTAADELVNMFNEIVLIAKDKDVVPATRSQAIKYIVETADKYYEENSEEVVKPVSEGSQLVEDEVDNQPLISTEFTGEFNSLN